MNIKLNVYMYEFDQSASIRMGVSRRRVCLAMSPGRHHHTVHAKHMAVLIHAQSSSTDSQADPKPPSDPAFDHQERRAEAALVTVEDTTATMVYDPVPSTPTILRASQVALPEPPTSLAGPSTRISNRELAFVITAALFGLGVLLLGAGIAHLMRRRRRGRSPTSRSADTQERGLDVTSDFDDSTWGTKRNRFQEHLAEPPRLPTPSTLTPCLSTPCLSHPDAHTDAQTPSTELTAILEQFEQRLYQEETDIALALHIAFGDESTGTTRHCTPFFAGSEDDVNTMLSLQAGMESVGKRSGGIRNRARQGSDASASSQSTTATVEGFSSHSSSTSSLTSIESMMSDIDESAEEGEEDAVYEVKRAQTHSMEIQKGKLIAWQPGGVRLMVTGPSTTTLGTASSSVSVDLDEFPLPP
ncbi:hypothetical protein B0H17DRAFT_98914 [Mycena rosella]|uniref:Uncharacterized protein n=1 Tax=Mycena rosella TaxID=1033263 RepID=A0AAD7GNK6_MYCRO|nr:hypothetical protein B0H17DRAFT_98914 [Mycena rosella]